MLILEIYGLRFMFSFSLTTMILRVADRTDAAPVMDQEEPDVPLPTYDKRCPASAGHFSYVGHLTEGSTGTVILMLHCTIFSMVNIILCCPTPSQLAYN